MNGKGVAVVIVLMFALALGAGAALGRLFFRSAPNLPPPDAVRGTLSDVLHLTPTQISQMKQIWEGASKTSNDCIDDAKRIQKDEDDELINHILAGPEQKKQFETLRAQSKAKLDALAKKRDSAFDKAVEETLPILNDEQRRIYKKIVQDRTGAYPGVPVGGSSQVWNPPDIAPISIGDDVQMDLGSTHTWHLPDRASCW